MPGESIGANLLSKYNFLSYEVSEPYGWHAVVDAIHFGPFDTKMELMDCICLEFSLEPYKVAL